MYRFFRSRALALVLLGVVVVAVILGAMVPQELKHTPQEYQAWKASRGALGSLLEAIGWSNIFTSWWFLAAVGLLFLNTLVCTVARVSEELRGTDWPRQETQGLGGYDGEGGGKEEAGEFGETASLPTPDQEGGEAGQEASQEA